MWAWILVFTRPHLVVWGVLFWGFLGFLNIFLLEACPGWTAVLLANHFLNFLGGWSIPVNWTSWQHGDIWQWVQPRAQGFVFRKGRWSGRKYFKHWTTGLCGVCKIQDHHTKWRGQKGSSAYLTKAWILRISFLLSSALTFSTLRKYLTWQHLLPISFPPWMGLQPVVSSYSTCRNWLFILQLSENPCRTLMKRGGAGVYVTGSHPFSPGEWSSLKGRGLKYQRSGREEERIQSHCRDLSKILNS